MSKDYILHFQPEIPQVMVAQENSDGQIHILNVIKGEEALDVMHKILN